MSSAKTASEASLKGEGEVIRSTACWEVGSVLHQDCPQNRHRVRRCVGGRCSSSAKIASETSTQEANNRTRIGDWEADTVIGRSGGACLVTLVDRKSRFLISSKAKKKDSVSVKDTMISCLTGQPCHSITPDRSMEFAKHAEISVALLDCKFKAIKGIQKWRCQEKCSL